MFWLSILASLAARWRGLVGTEDPLAFAYVTMVLAALGHGFFWLGVVNRLHACRIYRPLLDAVTYACAAACIALPLLIAYHAIADGAAWSAPLPTAAAARWYVFACAIFGAASIVFKWNEERTRYDRQALVDSATEIQDVHPANGEQLVTGRFATAFREFPGNQVGQIHIEKKKLLIPQLPPELDGLRLVHLSDLHMTGRVSRAFYDQLTASVNQTQADVIALTGDIVEKVECWDWLAETLNRMVARYGKYFVLGNHDFYIDTEETIQRLTSAGWTYVGGKRLRESWQGVAVDVVGNELPWRGPAPEDSLDPEAARSLFRLTLLPYARPVFAARLRRRALSLAGHTHGGQVCLPLLGPLASPSIHGTRFACGLFRRGSDILYVSRGLGGKTPLRSNCGPELAVLELASAPVPSRQARSSGRGRQR